MAAKFAKGRQEVSIDVEDYAKRRRAEIERMARRMASQAKREGRKVLLPPMNPKERRIVHLTLPADEGVETVSEGEGEVKRVAILPKGCFT